MVCEGVQMGVMTTHIVPFQTQPRSYSCRWCLSMSFDKHHDFGILTSQKWYRSLVIDGTLPHLLPTLCAPLLREPCRLLQRKPGTSLCCCLGPSSR